MDGTISNDNIEHRCEKCLKEYSRDLLMRHRRRCQNKTNVVSKRKACVACVKAKIKCSYSKPTCVRCEKRELFCDYPMHPESATGGNTSQSDHSAGTESGEITPCLDNTPEDAVYRDSTDELRELDPDFHWTSAISPVILGDSSEILNHFQFPGETDFSRSQVLQPTTLQELELPRNIVSILRRYPKMLLNEDFRSPFLHRDLYDEVGLDMTTLTRTSMAVICSAGLECAESRSYAIRAMDSHRQCLIEEFPKQTCLYQWDTVHAMLLYELLDMQNPHAPKAGFWKPGSRTKGTQIPFLIKMIKTLCEAHPDIAASESFRRPLTWQAWAVAETVQRTIFLANMVNFFANRDLDKKEQSLYYHQLDHDLILSMTLPCGQSLWAATDEEQWVKARESEKTSPHAVFDLGPYSTGQPTLRELLSSYTKDELRHSFGHSYGVSDSESLRSLVVLAALEQFT